MRRLVIAVIVLGSAAVAADTIEDKRHKEDAEKNVAFHAKSMNKACKTTIPDTGIIDWSTWKVLVDEKNNKVGSPCGYVAYGIRSLCGSDKIAQEMVAKDIDKITCMGDSTEDLTFEMKGKTLVVHTRLGVRDTDKKTKNWLTKNLH